LFVRKIDPTTDELIAIIVTFNDLQGTAVMRLALAECTEAEIATITGHSLRDVYSILDAHYLHAIQRWPRARLESSKREQFSQLTAQLVQDVLIVTGGKPSEINGGRTRTRTLDPLIKRRHN
jgi:hypothetical protein